MNNSQTKLNLFLKILISSLPIIGIGFIDNHIWDLIFVILGMIAYSIVGLLYSFGLISTKKEGSEANKYIFCFLALVAYFFYELLWKIKTFLGGLSIYLKILVPLLIVLVVIFIYFVKSKKESEQKQ